MSQEVKAVTEVIKTDLANLKVRAETLAAEMKGHIKDIADALDITKELSTELRNVGAELRGSLGTLTNNPPRNPNE